MTQAAPDLSPLALVLQADPVVQGVMALLLLASLACWAIILEKAVLLRRLAGAQRGGQAEWREGRGTRRRSRRGRG
ncbi:hypothetical protein CKO45_32370, partial [Paracraurococcus ruber]|nr:hypothetical protein [Paracraurococcus ruber]